MNMYKTFTSLETLNIVSFINQFSSNSEKMDSLPLKFKWNLSKNLKKLAPIAQDYEAFRDKELQKIQHSWFDEEHSEEFMQTKYGADGKPELDESGAEITEPARKIKDEYMDEYRKVVEELNGKLNEIITENNKIELSCVDFDEFVENLPDDTKLDIQDLNMLSFMDTVTNITKEAE